MTAPFREQLQLCHSFAGKDVLPTCAPTGPIFGAGGPVRHSTVTLGLEAKV